MSSSSLKAIIKEMNLLQYMDKVEMKERDKEIVKRYIDEDIKLVDLGGQYNIGRERVRQILVKYISKSLKFHSPEKGKE